MGRKDLVVIDAELEKECAAVMGITAGFADREGIRTLMAFAQRQRAVGIREVEGHCTDRADCTSGAWARYCYQLIAAWCRLHAEDTIRRAEMEERAHLSARR